MVAFAEYQQYDALGLAELVRSGQVSPLELVEAAIARIEAVNPQINAVTYTMFNQARQAAQRDLPDGPLRGVPFLVKDLLALVAGAPTSSSTRASSRIGHPPSTVRWCGAGKRPGWSSWARPTRRSSASRPTPSRRSSARRATPTTWRARPAAPAAVPARRWPRA
jgi:hypothetical protein